MSGASVTVNLSELKAMDGAIVDMILRAENRLPMMEAIGEIMVTSTMENFEGEHEPDGTPWKPSQRVMKFGGKTLTLRGHLSGSTTYQASNDETEIGSNIVYARPQHAGWPDRNIPARRIYGLGGDDEQSIEEVAAEFVLGGLAA